MLEGKMKVVHLLRSDSVVMLQTLQDKDKKKLVIYNLLKIRPSVAQL